MNSAVTHSKAVIISASVLALLTWFCVILQFYITEGSMMNTISFFTVLSNLLVALCLTFSTLFPTTKLGIFFSNHSTQTAIGLYIFIVFLVYNTFLRGIWKPQGWQLFLDNMLHVLIPFSYLFYWIFFVDKKKLNWKNGLFWLIFPTVYLFYSLIRGYIVNWYPYPFLNMSELGYEKVLINILAMILAFLLAGLALIGINNKLYRTQDSPTLF